MSQNTTNKTLTGRVVGIDAHPDTFTAAILLGQTPAQAQVEKVFNRIPISQLKSWAAKHTTTQDRMVLEASGNSFEVVRRLAGIGRDARVLESVQLGKLKEAHANNDKISAVRIAKAYLAGTSKEVWVPDPVSQERRDWMHAHRKVVKRTTQVHNRIDSYLSDNGLRFPKSIGPQDGPMLQQAKQWTPRQWAVLEGLLMELGHAEEQRTHWVSLMAQEVLHDPVLLSLTRLCGIRHITAFALGAVIGDIHRFAEPKKLVKYVGLNPAFDDSGENQWSGGIGGGRGREDLRSLLIESAHSILRTDHPLSQWGRKLLARKGEINLAVAAVARKLTVAIWYLMMGQETPVEDIDQRTARKVSRMITQVGKKPLALTGQTRRQLRDEVYQRIKHGRVYQLDPNKKMPPSSDQPARPVSDQPVDPGAGRAGSGAGSEPRLSERARRVRNAVATGGDASSLREPSPPLARPLG